MATKVTMPALGESVVEGTVGKWRVAVGQFIQKDQPLVEILTDKADTEVPAPVSGLVTQLFATEDQTVGVGGELCEIDETASAGAQAASAPAAAAPAASPAPAPAASALQPSEKVATQTAPSSQDHDVMASPAVRKLAREKGVDIEQLKGSGPSGRISWEDVMRAGLPAAAAPAAPAPAVPSAAPKAPATPSANGLGAFRVPPYTPQPGDEVIPFSRRRRIIADHMVYSKHTAPDVVTLAECDLHETAKLREANKNALKKEGINLNYLAFMAAAVCRALREHPDLNARVLEDAYVKLREINLGVAVDTPEGLVVPVIRNADQLTVRGLAKAIDDIAERSRKGKLSPDDLAGKTFTISNPGRKGNLVGGAIISQPNVGILRVGTMKKRVVVVERDGEDLLAIHPVVHMALTYDHRIVDGVQANSFLFRVVELLEAGEFEI